MNNLEVDFEERKEYNFVKDMLQMKKTNAQLQIPEETLIQVINRERAIYTYNKHKAKLEKDIRDQK